MNVGFSTAEEVADSAAEETDEAASEAASFASSTTSAAQTTVAPSRAEASAAKRMVAVQLQQPVRCKELKRNDQRREGLRCSLMVSKSERLGEVDKW